MTAAAPDLVHLLLDSPAPGVSRITLNRPEKRNALNNQLRGEIFATLERTIAQRIEQQRNSGIRNASALLIDTDTMQVKALVGSADFHDDDIDGQVFDPAAVARDTLHRDKPKRATPLGRRTRNAQLHAPNPAF